MVPVKANAILFQSSQQLPHLDLEPREGLFDLAKVSFKGPPYGPSNLPHMLLPELQTNENILRCAAALGTKGQLKTTNAFLEGVLRLRKP